MVRSFIRHHVSDYAAWREVYDSFGDAQREHGVRAEAVYRGVDDPNDVTVTHDFDDACRSGQCQYETARDFYQDGIRLHRLSDLRARGIWPME